MKTKFTSLMFFSMLFGVTLLLAMEEDPGELKRSNIMQDDGDRSLSSDDESSGSFKITRVVPQSEAVAEKEDWSDIEFTSDIEAPENRSYPFLYRLKADIGDGKPVYISLVDKKFCKITEKDPDEFAHHKDELCLEKKALVELFERYQTQEELMRYTYPYLSRAAVFFTEKKEDKYVYIPLYDSIIYQIGESNEIKHELRIHEERLQSVFETYRKLNKLFGSKKEYDEAVEEQVKEGLDKAVEEKLKTLDEYKKGHNAGFDQGMLAAETGMTWFQKHPKLTFISGMATSAGLVGAAWGLKTWWSSRQ